MSKSLEFSIGRMSNPDISCYSDSDWSKAVEISSEEFFDLYIDGCRDFKVGGQDENGQPISVNTRLTFDEEGDFQYCAVKECVCDGTLLFLENLKYKFVSAVCCAKTICKDIEPVENGDTIDYTIGNFIILSEDCESPDKDKPWLKDRFIVALPLKTCKSNQSNNEVTKKETKSVTNYLHEFVGKESDRYISFRDRHYRKCGNGNQYDVHLLGTGIGEAISVRCPFCGEKEDITDSDAW